MVAAMTKRKRAGLHFRGDRRASFRVGQAMGPGSDGLFRRVTAVSYDRVRKMTVVELETHHVAPEGRRLRYHGGADAEPEPSIAPDDPIEPK